MKNFKGTQGKWEIVQEYSHGETNIKCGNKRIAQVKHFGDSKNIKNTCLKYDPCEKEGKENARLIVNAPELLNFINSFISDFEGDYVMNDGSIVDNPSFLLKHNYEKAKIIVDKILK